VDLCLLRRVALVIAASKGLGRASALALADEGAAVAICARGDALRHTEGDLAARTDDVLAMVADVTEPDAPHRLVEATVERFGRLDIVVTNAGGPPPGCALDVDDEALGVPVLGGGPVRERRRPPGRRGRHRRPAVTGYRPGVR